MNAFLALVAAGSEAVAVVCGRLAAGREITNSLPLPVPSLDAVTRPTVHLGEFLHDGEPDAQPAFRAGDRTLALREQLEHVGQLLGRDADAVVPHLDDDVLAFEPGGQPDPAPALGVLGGVRQQVHDDLLDSRRVGPDRQGILLERRDQLVLPLFDERADRFDGLVEDVGRVHKLLLQANLPAGDPRDVEQVVNQADELSHLSFDDVLGEVDILRHRRTS